MKNRAQSKEPVTMWVLPPFAPEPVAKAMAHFHDMADGYEDAKDDVKVAEQAVETAKRDEQAEVAVAYQRGEEPKLGKGIERAQAQLDAAVRRRSGFQQAVDDAGNALVELVTEHRSEWLGNVAE